MDHLSAPKKSQYQTIGQGGLAFQNDIPLQNRKDPRPRYESLDFSYREESPGLQKNGTLPRRPREGGTKVIFVSLALIVVPMVGLAALLLGLVLSNNVEKPENSPSRELTLDLRSEFDSDAYYVDFNPTTLVTIASWSSTVAPLLAVCAMILVSFPLAESLRNESQSSGSDLPTPFQFSLLLECFTAGITPLWNALSYRRWKHSGRMASTVRNALTVLAIFTILGYALKILRPPCSSSNGPVDTQLPPSTLGCI